MNPILFLSLATLATATSAAACFANFFQTQKNYLGITPYTLAPALVASAHACLAASAFLATMASVIPLI